MRRARYTSEGYLALEPKAFGLEFELRGGVPPAPFVDVDGVAVIRIEGPLEQHQHWCWQDYDTIREQATAAFASASRAVALVINSPGGAAAGCFELTRALRAMAVESGKPLGVFVDGMACSAAFAIATAATAGIWAPGTATVGSLAVYEMQVDVTEADRQMGLKYTFIPSTGADLKLVGNPHLPASEEMLRHTQMQVDTLTSYFYALVEEMRGIPEEQIREMRGATQLAAIALTRRLIDGLSDRESFLGKLRTAQGMSTMSTAQAKADPFEAALSQLTEATRSEDPEVAKKAKKMLADHYKAETKAAEDGGGEKSEPEKKDGDDKAKAEADEKEKARATAEEDEKAKAAKAEEDEKAKAAKAEEEKMQAQARASVTSNDAVNAKIAELEKSNRALADTVERDKLLASRPDIAVEIREVLALAPLSVVQKAVKDIPRVKVSAQASANAATAGGETRGQNDSGRGKWSGDEQRLLDQLDGKSSSMGRGPHMEGTRLVLDYMSPEQAATRAQEMLAAGQVPAHRAPQNVTSKVLSTKA